MNAVKEDVELPAIVLHHAREGERRFSRWDDALFRSVVLGAGKRLAAGLEADVTTNELLFESWLRLVVEAIGLGYVRAGFVGTDGKRTRPAENLVELLLVELLPDKLPTLPPAARISELAKAWNLAEGLFGEPPWLNLCVASAMASVGTIVDLEGRLLRILDAALAPRARSSFGGPFTVRTIDLREIDAAFLPGRLHFGSPSLLCVHDRKRPTLSGGVLVGARGAPSLTFRSPCLAEKNPEEEGLPTVTLAPSSLCIGDARVPLPAFKRGHTVARSRAGIVVVTALDSQRLWIVESP